MYAKSIVEYFQARAVAGNWSRHITFMPVVMALSVATLPFTLKLPAVEQDESLSAPAQDRIEQSAVDNPFTGLVQASVVVGPKRTTALPLDVQQRAVADFIRRKYGVSAEVVQELVRTAFTAGKRYGVDPLLVVAIMAVESSYNPIAESYAGAKGLMQIIPKYHLEKFEEFGGAHAAFDPRVNIMVGARILREYLMMHSGDLLNALQTYAGAMADKDAIYTQRVLNEKDHLDTLAGFPKTERRSRIVVQLEPEAPGARVTVKPSPPLLLQPELQFGPTPDAPVPQPTTKLGDEPAHTPPSQPQAQPAGQPPVNLAQAAPELVRI